ncbi:MAG: MBOAT family protein [Cyclobacteriaceae bacterium]|nr:MBOAT family protein [Cyclobacteriaceae bacterium]
MLFSSPEFIFLFLPTTLFVYFFLSRQSNFIYAKIWLLFASLFFYAYWHPANVLIIILSALFNFYASRLLYKSKSKVLLVAGIIINLGVLGYYKYADFFLENINALVDEPFPLLHIALPLGISFFTFQQIAFLVDAFSRKVQNFSFADYCLFVTFFPQLIAGPIVHHSEMMPQFSNPINQKVNLNNITLGLFVFNMGLAKKLIIADSLSNVVAQGYNHADKLSVMQAWVTSIFYSMQLYFDFSGYSDMAIGLGLLFNIHIPINFNSPYKAENIQEFWRRWHITLSTFLRDYVYIPMGGSKHGEWKTYRNLIYTFLIGGIWHGAGWTFIIWGGLHGLALAWHRFFSKFKVQVPKFGAVVITFLFVNITWVFFRADGWQTAINLLLSMIGLNKSIGTSVVLMNDFYSLPIWIAAVILLFGKNTNQIARNFNFNNSYGWKLMALIILNLIYLNSTISQEFLYFDF